MKFRLLIILILAGFSMNGQEYWDRKDFEIRPNKIENSWKDLSFSWQSESDFILPDGTFKDENLIQKKEIDMVGIIKQANSYKPKTIDLGSPIQIIKKERKTIEFTAETMVRDYDDIFNNPYYASPFRSNFNANPYYYRRYTPTRSRF
ncbi:hypothetical protein [Gramella sp. AN32]|uniref:Uncharacterized protein n=1 Tax=Christiangramia antarctica TaxID=2058158 RepID=A0ABW5X2J1_9FLAO|nr:hypothetical protein [Gramella sp. AN32]MCM4157157.1 hypothetical protein [Gramella sp. AN32]